MPKNVRDIDYTVNLIVELANRRLKVEADDKDENLLQISKEAKKSLIEAVCDLVQPEREELLGLEADNNELVKKNKILTQQLDTIGCKIEELKAQLNGQAKILDETLTANKQLQNENEGLKEISKEYNAQAAKYLHQLTITEENEKLINQLFNENEQLKIENAQLKRKPIIQDEPDFAMYKAAVNPSVDENSKGVKVKEHRFFGRMKKKIENPHNITPDGAGLDYQLK